MVHECGHANFHHRGYLVDTDYALEAEGLDDVDKYGHLSGVLNEPSAKILEHRAWWYQSIDNPDKDSVEWAELSWARSIEPYFEVDGFYWHWYNVTEHSPEKLSDLVQIGTRTFLREFKNDYQLYNDPYLPPVPGAS